MALQSNQRLNSGSLPSFQEALLNLAQYIAANITTQSVSKQQVILVAIQQTLRNMLDILDAYQIQSLLAQEYSLLTRISVNTLTISAQDRMLINKRLIALNALITSIYPLPLVLPFIVNNLTSGQPAVQPYDLISYFVTFNAEVPPAGITLSNFLVNAQAMATAWQDTITFLANNTNTTPYQASAYNPVDRMYQSSQDTINLVNNIVFSPNITTAELAQLWNSLIALPSMLRVAALLYNDPSTQLSQSINVLKFVIINLIIVTNSVLASFSVPNNVQQPTTAILRSGESLLDFAARTTGDYTKWTAVAASNNLSPPYVGTVPALGIAVPGQKLFLPPFSSSSPIANYSDSFLGTDIDIGFPFTTLSTWSGSFTLIKGINNFIGALARRVLTPLGSLIYHTSYGSLIPQEAGAVQTANEAILLASYLKSAVLSDTRTQAVNQITAYPVNFGQIVLTALVTPFGTAANVPFNLVIVPQSASVTKS